MKRHFFLPRNRRAQAETQLNWIFILVAGALILAFFGFIIVKQRAASEAKFAGKVSQQLNTILVGAKVSSGTVQEIQTPELSIRFTCNDYYIGPAGQRLGNKIVFAPEYVEGDRLITWTLDWNVPFKITSFLYMTTPSVRYVVIGKTAEDPGAKEVFDSLPKKLNKRMFSMADYESGKVVSDNDKYVRFIFVNVRSVPASFNIPAGFEKVSVSGINIDTVSRKFNFMSRSAAESAAFNQEGSPQTYLEKEAMYGAIFLTKADEYECLMRRAYERLNLVSRVYFEKFNQIAPVYEAGYCEGNYKNNPEIEDLIKATRSYPPDYAVIGGVKDNLARMNKDLQLKSCPLIY
jgi:hypothetical protein